MMSLNMEKMLVTIRADCRGHREVCDDWNCPERVPEGDLNSSCKIPSMKINSKKIGADRNQSFVSFVFLSSFIEIQ